MIYSVVKFSRRTYFQNNISCCGNSYVTCLIQSIVGVRWTVTSIVKRRAEKKSAFFWFTEVCVSCPPDVDINIRSEFVSDTRNTTMRRNICGSGRRIISGWKYCSCSHQWKQRYRVVIDILKTDISAKRTEDYLELRSQLTVILKWPQYFYFFSHLTYNKNDRTKEITVISETNNLPFTLKRKIYWFVNRHIRNINYSDCNFPSLNSVHPWLALREEWTSFSLLLTSFGKIKAKNLSDSNNHTNISKTCFLYIHDQ